MNDTTGTLNVLYSVGHRLLDLERHHDAISLFRTMLIVDPSDERGWLALATCHEALDETDKAIAICRLAETACGGRAFRCMIARARIQRALGANEEAALTYEHALSLAESHGDDEAHELLQSELGAT